MSLVIHSDSAKVICNPNTGYVLKASSGSLWGQGGGGGGGGDERGNQFNVFH